MKRRIAFILGIGILGALAGWLYWSRIGCDSGSCAITAHPVNSTLYGALLGGLLGDFLASLLRRKEMTPQDHERVP